MKMAANVWSWIDDRTGLSKIFATMLRHPVPRGARWLYVFGSATLTAFLADAPIPAEHCDQVGLSPGEAYERGLRQSVAFANFMRLADERSAGRIRFEIVSRGNAVPLVGYPPTLTGITAGEWNAVAALNNRVEVQIVPD